MSSFGGNPLIRDREGAEKRELFVFQRIATSLARLG